jgi:predicted Ser/Thr protein kinase
VNVRSVRSTIRPEQQDRPGRLLHEGRNLTKARVWLVGFRPDVFVIKDISATPAWVRWLFARRSLAREARAYRALRGLPGIPRLIAAEDPERLEISHVEGVPLPSLPRESLSEALFDRLAALLSEIHRRGVACGDIHHRNVIIGKDGSVHMVDFALAITLTAGTNPLRRWLFRRMTQLDEAALVRLRTRYLGREPTAHERAVLSRVSVLWKAGRILKWALRSLRRREGSA